MQRIGLKCTDAVHGYREKVCSNAKMVLYMMSGPTMSKASPVLKCHLVTIDSRLERIFSQEEEAWFIYS